MNFNQLATRITDYIENDEASFVANIPYFIRAVEQKVFNATQLPKTRANVVGVLQSGNPYLTLPDNFLSAFSVAVGGGNQIGVFDFLINKDANFIREAYPDEAEMGRPKYYGVFDEDTLIVGPTPDANYGIELTYYRYPPSIVDEGTSWLGDHFDTVLLYGSLAEANMYIKGDEDMQKMYEQRFLESLGQLKVLADGKLRRDAYRSGQTRIDVP